jgi:hypothetical protein
LGIDHPPNGTEYALGCGLCRHNAILEPEKGKKPKVPKIPEIRPINPPPNMFIRPLIPPNNNV